MRGDVSSMDWLNELPHIAGTVLGIDELLPEEAIITLKRAEIGEKIRIKRPWVDENNIVQCPEAIYEVMELDDPHITRRNLTGWHEYGRFCRIRKIKFTLV